MREFGKTYNGNDEIYIKIRVELSPQAECGEHATFVMSFHYAMIPFCQESFPYQRCSYGSYEESEEVMSVLYG